ncbi:MAG TPA: DMT family transporter [Baekduia sp.]|nr:DMT family transporter [Baekduia sp.]
MTGRGLLLFAVAAALWGGSYLFIKVALDDGVSEPFIVFSRTLLGALVLVPLGLRAGALRPLLQRGWWIVGLAGLQVVLPFGLITYGERSLHSGLAGVLIASSPLFLALIALRVDREERSEGWALVGLLVGIAGVAVLFGADLTGDADALLGGVMILGAALSYAAAVLIVKRRFTGVAPVGVAASTMVVSSVAWLPAALLTAPSAVPPADSVLSLLVLGAGGTGIAFYCFYTLISDVGPARASLVAYVAPAFAVVYGVTLLDEPLTAGTVIGLALILGGSWLAAGGRLSRSAPSRSSAPAPARAR